MRKIFIIGSLAFAFAACKPTVNLTTPPTAGDANFRSYLAIGNSLTAGFADGSLYVTGQLNSYPERLYEQFSMISGPQGATGDFIQPLLVTDQGFPGPKKVLQFVIHCNGDTSLSPVDFPGFSASATDAAPFANPSATGQINNIGVPGIRVADYPVQQYALLAAANPASPAPWAARFYHTPTGTPNDELKYRVSSQHTTFFTMWLGSNDVLLFALGGGQGDGSGNAAPGFLNFYNTTDITPTAVFKTNYDSAVAAAISTGAKGALINIPDVTTIPFFTTVPINGLILNTQAQADALTAFYSGSLHIVFKLGANNFVVEAHDGTVRQSVPGELVLLTVPQDSLTCAGWGSIKPIPKEYVITTEELQQIRNATAAYNAEILAQANLNNLAYVDMSTYLSTFASGITFNGVKYTSQFATGGAFSLDGIHLTPRGYALVANQIINTVNTKYHSTVHTLDVNQYKGVLFP